MGFISVARFDCRFWSVKATYYSKFLKFHAETTPGMRWDSEQSTWVGYPDAVDALLRRLDEQKLKYEATDFQKSLVDPLWCTTLPVSYEGSRDFQKEGIDFLIREGPTGALLAWDMRLGKTHAALRAARAFRLKTVIICPSHVVGVWARPTRDRKCEIQLWWPDAFAKTIILEGTIPKQECIARLVAAQIAVMHYEISHAWADVLIAAGFKLLIVDEIHAYQSEHSRRTEAGRKLAEACTVRFGLSGTPMINRPRDLFSTCNILSPGRFGDNFFKFGARYCDGHKETVGSGPAQKTVWNFDGRSNEEELARRLRFFMLRKTRVEVAAELPPETRQVINVVVERKYRLPASVEAFASKTSARRALDIAADGKLPAAINLLKEHAEQGSKVVCFGYRRAIVEHLSTALSAGKIPTAVIHGTVPQRKREDRIQAARDAPGAFILCATIDAASTGVDFSFASIVVFVELSWEPHDILQAKARVYRYDQMTPILVQIIIAEGTSDELVCAKLIEKLAAADAIIGGKDADGGIRKDLLGEKSGEDSLAEYCRELMADAKKTNKKEKIPRRVQEPVVGRVGRAPLGTRS